MSLSQEQQSSSRQAEKLRNELIQIAQTAKDLNKSELYDVCGKLVDLTTIAGQFEQSPSEVEFVQEIYTYCEEVLPVLLSELQSENGTANSDIESQLTLLDQRWGEYLDLLPESDRFSESSDDQWANAQNEDWGLKEVDETEGGDPESFEPASYGDVSELLSQLNELKSEAGEVASPTPKESPQPAQVSADFSSMIVETLEDPEMVSAYVDDAQHCLAGMETCLLELENDKNAVESLRQFCRELHTLKGASGTVGLMKLADYLHQLETSVEEMSRGGKKIDIDPLLTGVDFVRQQLSKFLPEGAEEAPVPTSTPVRPQVQQQTQPRAATQTPADVISRANMGETYVRLEASRLDRLMDLLAELVMLRNRRETYVTSLETLHHEINSCSTRLRLVDTHPEVTPLSNHSEGLHLQSQPSLDTKQLTRTITELSKDVKELGRVLHEVVDPLATDNSTISHLIGNFRSELMELRRQPITGLFRRIHRVARDAGKAENRQVELTLIGQGTRIERSLQERLYEPLMHLIRNSVSHGIESRTDRENAGKAVVGQISLEAWSDGTSMYLEIRDDGRGLNEYVLEKKGLELGLIRPGEKLSKEKLWELILMPGFSTKSEVSQISGRGVGMDVVASQIRSLRGKITIDSEVGKFTSFRLEIPLNSTIEHAMIVRCGEQLFALPMHSIYGTQSGDQIAEDQKVIGLHELLHVRSSHSSTQRVITLRQQETRSSSQVANDNLSIVVDAVVGVEEVVVRSLPALLHNHRCFSGVTLSGEAETVLVLDVPRLSEHALQLLPEMEHAMVPSPPARDEPSDSEMLKSNRGLNLRSQKILLVDDSISVRRSLHRKLEPHGFEIIEAADGIQGLEKIKNGQFVAVISDIDMPRMNGIDFVSELRRSEKYQDIPVVVVTSRRDEESIQSMKDLGVRQVFTKPVNDAMMKSLLHSIRFRMKTLESMSN